VTALARPVAVGPPHDLEGANRHVLATLHQRLAELAAAGYTVRTFAVTGSRTWFDWRLMWSALAHMPREAVQFNGKARGADHLAEVFWRAQGSEVRPFEPRWDAIGSKAGFVRNALMMEHMPQLVLAFLHHETPSNGTRQAIGEALMRNIPTFTFHQAA
jgi:YspA, cpYpsA-related SLOG family